MSIQAVGTEVGRTVELLVDEPLTVTDFVRYQGASGDMNPIHHDHAYAVAAGFDAPFAVGMRQAGVLGTLVAQEWGVDSLRDLDLRFRSQAWPGEVLTYRATVTGRPVEGDAELLHLALEVVRPDGSLHITGTATVALGPSVG